MPIVVRQLTQQGWRSLTAAPPPPTNNMLVGAASFHPPLSSHQSWLQILQPQVAPMTVRRCYEAESTGVPSSWSASEASIDIGKRATVTSLRPPIGDFNAGAFDAALRTFLRSIPDDGMPKFVTGWHEADSKVRRGEYTRTAFMQAIKRFGDIVHEEAIPNTYVVPCFTGWLWHDPAQAAGEPEQWWQPGVYDVLSVDYYDDTPAAMFDPVVAFAAAHDIPWAVSETGWTTPATKAARITATADYCATHGAGGWPSAVFQCWFDSNVGFDASLSEVAFTPTSAADAIAAAGAACVAHYRDPATLTLPT